MGIVTDPARAFRMCHGYKIGDELILWSDGVMGVLSDSQEDKCQWIVLEDYNGVPHVFRSRKEALASDIGHPKKADVFADVKRCSRILDIAEDEGVIRDLEDVYATLDYCMYKLGHNDLKHRPRDRVKKFVDKMLG